MMLQAPFISSSVITNGGAILMESSQNRNQSVITPNSIARSIIGFRTSKDSNSTEEKKLARNGVRYGLQSIRTNAKSNLSLKVRRMGQKYSYVIKQRNYRSEL
mgnify:CR=1 FL=1